MKNNDNTEELLLKGKSLDELIAIKMQEDIDAEIKQSKLKREIYFETDISKVPKNLIFSKKSIYKIYNKNLKSETFINGIQADGLLGLQNSIRERVLNGEISAFATDEAFVRFEKVEIERII